MKSLKAVADAGSFVEGLGPGKLNMASSSVKVESVNFVKMTRDVEILRLSTKKNISMLASN